MPVVYIQLQDEILVTCVTAIMPAVSVCACLIQHKYFNPSQSNLVSWIPTVWSNLIYEGWNFNSGNYLFTTDTK